jgi:hypothetical protein
VNLVIQRIFWEGCAQMIDQDITDADFIGLVRRYKPSSLVPLIAEVGAQYAHKGSWLEGEGFGLTPWALSDIARVSLVAGNEFRRDATRGDVIDCAKAYLATRDPELESGQPGAIEGFFLRLGHEQMPLQQSPEGEIVRSTAMFE